MNPEGRESEWNEANFKAKRLHDTQEMINFCKLNPLGHSDGKFNYDILLKSIENLHGEGASKYDTKERKECDRIKAIANKMLKIMPPHTLIFNQNLSGKNKSYVFNQQNFDKLMDILYEYEMLVKDYNDKHGLTTKNKRAGGYF